VPGPGDADHGENDENRSEPLRHRTFPSAVQPLRWHTGERLAKRAHGAAHLVSVRAQPVDALSNRCLRPRGRSDPRDLGEVIEMSVAREEVQAVLEGQ
jgi:hypothetical protein